MIDRIIETKQQEVAAIAGSRFPARKKPVLPLRLRPCVNIIAELKRRSPSAGWIGEINDERIAAYSRHACALSVLADGTFFGGSYTFLEEISRRTPLPILCKDFIIDKVQINRAFSAGADIILLIARILSPDLLAGLYTFARDLGLQCLVEIHSEEEVDKIRPLEASLIGVNARDLDTLAIDLERAARILAEVEAEARIAESGIRSRDDIERLSMADAFLVGETLMRSRDPDRTLRELIYG